MLWRPNDHPKELLSGSLGHGKEQMDQVLFLYQRITQITFSSEKSYRKTYLSYNENETEMTILWKRFELSQSCRF
jgi:hypothetical protein